jgi:NAD(P)-dependent dehydrogenase (short-subunit alcohol dehydrogenase family)
MGMLTGRVAAITGGASGMGRSVALRFAAEGAHVVVLDLNEKLGDAVVEELKASGAERPVFQVVDVSSPESVRAAFNTVGSTTDGVDVLVTCAGIRSIAPPLELHETEWQQVLAVNLSGTFYCCQEAARQMVKKKRGAIVTVASTAGLRAYESRPAYSASNGGVIALTHSLARDLAPLGVRVNCICPGMTKTPFTAAYFEDENLVANLARVIPLGRPAEPEEIAAGALFLASELSSYVSGVILPIDGGHITAVTFDPGGAADSVFTRATPVR